jgi:c-di-GMP-binding flagellar brake protein YcgR
MEKDKTEPSQFAFERRMNPRFQIELPVEYRRANDSRIRPGHTVNFSEDGFMICVSERMEADENLEMKIYFTSPAGFVTIPAIVKVVWADMEVKEDDYYRFGVNFLNISPADKELLQEFLKIYADPYQTVSEIKAPVRNCLNENKPSVS